MKTIYIILIIGILLLGTVGAVSFSSVKDKEFTIKVKIIDSEKICEKIKEKKGILYEEYKDKVCKDLEKVEVPDGFITQNDEGVYKIEYNK